MPTPDGVIWFTPGLMSGYVTMLAYLPCQGVSFSYTISRAPINHEVSIDLLSQLVPLIIHTIKKDGKYIKPEFCKYSIKTDSYQLPHV